MLIKCTKKLLDQLHIHPAASADEEPLFSWHANLITVNRRKTVVLVNDKNRYVIVLLGLRAKDFKMLDAHIIQAIRETFREECINDEIIEQFIYRSGGITYTKTRDRKHVARKVADTEKLDMITEELLDYKNIDEVEATLN